MLEDPELRGVGAVLFDEFHERHLYGDVTLGHVLKLTATRRPDLILGLLSATLDTGRLAQFLGGAPVLQAVGRPFPVRVVYQPPPRRPPFPPIWEQVVAAVERVLREEEAAEGHVLVFLPGVWEIQRTVEALRECSAVRGWDILPLYGELSPELQDAAIASSGRRKIVVATNLAESALTIEGVRVVVDSGLARIPRFDPSRGVDTLWIHRISKASAEQRAGRAGRTGPGLCVRLWSERDHHARPSYEDPEVVRVDLAEAVLILQGLGYSNVRSFRWLDPPPEASLERAEQLLQDLGAVRRGAGLTDLGRQMVQFPVHPRYARMLLEATREGVVEDVALIAALVQGRDIFTPRCDADMERRRDLEWGPVRDSDFFLRMRAVRWAAQQGWDPRAGERLGVRMGAAREVAEVAERFCTIARRMGTPVGRSRSDTAAVRRCILAGLADQVAVRLDRGTYRCRLVHGRSGELARTSVVRHASWLVAAEVRERQGRDVSVVLSLATAIEPEWLPTMFPDAIQETSGVEWDTRSERVIGWRRRLYHDLILAQEVVAPDPASAAAILADQIQRGTIRLPSWDTAVERWLNRIRWLARVRPDLGVRPPDDELLQQLFVRLCLGCTSAREVKERPVLPLLRAQWSKDEQAILDRFAPERVRLGNGRSVRVEYEAAGEPWIAVTIQQLYGTTEAPRILDETFPLTVKILAPNQRPVQVTRDLASFWCHEYPRVRAMLARQYPRHEWR
jgi:ATP-dependent helicase HrpB